MKLPTSNPFLSKITALAALVASQAAHALDGTWTGITGNWTDAPTWSGGTLATGADYTAFFTGVDIAADQTITLNGNRTIGNITFTDATTSSHNLTITGNTLTFDRTSGVPSIDVTQAGRQLSISSIIAGNDGLQKNGAGTLSLTSANTFTGGLTINAGTVFVNPAPGVNPLSSGKVTIGDVANTGAAAELLYIGTSGNNSFGNLIDVRGNGTATIRVLGYNPTFSGAINLANNLKVISDNSFGSTIGISGGVTGTGNLVIQSNAANGAASSAITFSGTTLNFTGTITNSGTTTSTTASHTTISAAIGTNVTGITQNSTNSNLILTGANSFTSNILVSAGTLQANLASGSANPTTGALGNAQALGRTATISSGATLRFGVSNVLGNGGSTPNLTIIANGGTILHVVNGDINSIGPVQLNGGNLSSTGTGAGGFKLTGTVTVGGSALSTISASGIIGSGSVITYDVADAVVGSGSDLNVTAVVADIFGAGGIIKTGAGTMTLSNQNTFTGGTRIDNGTLTLNHATNTLLNTGAVNVNGGTLALGTNTDTVGAVTLTSGSITGSGAGTLTGSSYDVRSGSVSAKLAGTSVALTKSTGGTVTLSGTNTYTGVTNVTGGTLSISGTGSTHASSAVTVTNSGSALVVDGTVNGTLIANVSTTISGIGTVNGAATINGNHNPGNSPGIQTFASGLTYSSTAILNAEFVGDTLGSRGTDYDGVNVTGGNLSIDSLATLSLYTSGIDYTAAVWDASRAFTVIDYLGAGSSTGVFQLVTTNAGSFASQGSWSLANTSNDIVLSWTPVPEPGAALLGSLGLLALLRRRRN